MAEKANSFDFYEEYVSVKSAHLMSRIDNLIRKMQEERCTIRHYKQWEAEMTSFKEEYRIFRKNILRWINDNEDSEIESMVCPYCEQVEDRYEILAQIFLEKSNEIKKRTTYFETQNSNQKEHRYLIKVKKIYEKIDTQLLSLKLKRK